jgi:hypothetical protein
VIYHQDVFISMGLETMPTRTNRDDGVMPLAFDTTGTVGGRVAFQPKWYSHIVGVRGARSLPHLLNSMKTHTRRCSDN